jgi:hypothetical protein
MALKRELPLSGERFLGIVSFFENLSPNHSPFDQTLFRVDAKKSLGFIQVTRRFIKIGFKVDEISGRNSSTSLYLGFVLLPF